MFYETRDKAPLSPDPFKSLVVPRPIGWISSVDRNGRVNLAPFSFFNAVADGPPVVAFSPSGTKEDGALKDTLLNVRETGEFVCNLATWDLREKMNATSAEFPAGTDELKTVGLTPLPSRLVKPPRVAEAPAHLECRLWQIVDLPSANPAEPNFLVIGQVVGIHIDDSVIKNGRVDIVSVRPIARLGYSEYASVESKFSMRRP